MREARYNIHWSTGNVGIVYLHKGSGCVVAFKHAASIYSSVFPHKPKESGAGSHFKLTAQEQLCVGKDETMNPDIVWLGGGSELQEMPSDS